MDGGRRIRSMTTALARPFRECPLVGRFVACFVLVALRYVFVSMLSRLVVPCTATMTHTILGVVWYDEEAAKRDLRSIAVVRDKLLLQSVLHEFRKNGKLIAGGRKRLRRGECFDLDFPYTSLGISVALAQECERADGKPRRKAVVVDSIGPNCPPRAQLALSPGDEVVKIDGAPIDATLEGFRMVLTKMRCGKRPVKLSFRKARTSQESIPPAPYGTTSEKERVIGTSPKLFGSIETTRAVEVAVVDLTEDDCVDCDLDDDFEDEEEADLDSFVKTITPTALKHEREVALSKEHDELEDYPGHDQTFSHVADLDERAEDPAVHHDSYVASADLDQIDAMNVNVEDDDVSDIHAMKSGRSDMLESQGDQSAEEDEYSLTIQSTATETAHGQYFVQQRTPRASSRPSEEDEYSLAIASTAAGSAHGQHFVIEDSCQTAARHYELAEDDGETYATAPQRDVSAVDVVAEDSGAVQVVHEEPAVAGNTTRGGDAAAVETADLDDVIADLDDEEEIDSVIPFVRSSELSGHETDSISPVDAVKQGALNLTLHRIPYQRTPQPLQPLSTAVEVNEEGTFGALLEPSSRVGKHLVVRNEPMESTDEIQFCVYDRVGNYRSCFCLDGSVRNNRDELLGYLNLETLQAGSASEDFLGELLSESPSEDELCARGPFDEFCAVVDLSKARLADRANSTLAEFTRMGEVISNDGLRLGRFEPFTYNDVRTAALYLLFLDPGMLSPVELDRDEQVDN